MMNQFKGQIFKTAREALEAARPFNYDFTCTTCGVKLNSCKYVAKPADPKNFSGPRIIVELEDKPRYCTKHFVR